MLKVIKTEYDLWLDYLTVINDIEKLRGLYSKITGRYVTIPYEVDYMRSQAHGALFKHYNEKINGIREVNFQILCSHLEDAVGFKPPFNTHAPVKKYARKLATLMSTVEGVNFITGKTDKHNGTDGVLKGW